MAAGVLLFSFIIYGPLSPAVITPVSYSGCRSRSLHVRSEDPGFPALHEKHN
ncbi:hypothetical protein J6590_028356 [Homalodisca vitripennis]|nr:hypothetical protein J6590_028356 [Homalodisca vitripennis]